MEREALSILSLSHKAGALVSGEEAVVDSVKDGHAVLVIAAADASANTKKRLKDKAVFRNVEYVEFGSKESLGRAIGKEERSGIALTDEGLKNLFLMKLN